MFARDMSFIMHKHPENALRDLKELCNPISSKQNRPHIVKHSFMYAAKTQRKSFSSESALNTEPPQGAAAIIEAVIERKASLKRIFI